MALSSPRAGARAGTYVPLDWPLDKMYEWCKQIAQALSSLLDGKLNTVSTATLTANAATTTISDVRIGPDTVVVLVPKTANAAAALATTYQTLPNTTAGQAVINHANNGLTDKTFATILIG